MVDVPYGIVWDQLKAGNVIPFFGAGASLSERTLEHATFPLSAAELAEQLADNCGFPSQEKQDRTNLSLVSSYFEAVGADRTALRDKLRNLFEPKAGLPQSPPSIFRLIAKVPKHILTITTNYDVFVEQAFREEGRPYHLIVHSCDEPENANAVHWWKPGESEPITLHSAQVDITEKDLEQASVIYKMHGSVCPRCAHDSFLISEEDYVRFLAMQNVIPSSLISMFQIRRFLFLGYGLRDWNLRVLLSQLRLSSPLRMRGNLRSWAIQRTPSALDVALWEKRWVNVYGIDLAQFTTELARIAGLILSAPS